MKAIVGILLGVLAAVGVSTAQWLMWNAGEDPTRRGMTYGALAIGLVIGLISVLTIVRGTRQSAAGYVLALSTVAITGLAFWLTGYSGSSELFAIPDTPVRFAKSVAGWLLIGASLGLTAVAPVSSVIRKAPEGY